MKLASLSIVALLFARTCPPLPADDWKAYFGGI